MPRFKAETRRWSGEDCIPTGTVGTRYPFWGYRIARSGLGPGAKARHRLRQRLRRAHDLPQEALERSLADYRGMWMTL